MTAPSPTPTPQVEPPTLPGLNASLERYAQILDAFTSDRRALLPALVARDRIDAELRQRTQSGEALMADRERVRRQLAVLVERIKRDHPSYQDALLFQHRLRENLDQAERYGDTETLRAERARVVEQLNSLVLAALGLPFNQLAADLAAPTATTDELPSRQLVALDTRLRQLAFRRLTPLAELPAWRISFGPPETAWWWRLDLQFVASERERDLPWYLGTALCTTVSLAVSAEIIRRLWSGAPDTLAVFGTVLTLLLTGGPLLKRGSELGQWIFDRIPLLSPRYRGETNFGVVFLAMLGVLVCWFSLPGLGTLYNNWGYSALDTGDMVAAERWFQRATALRPELPVPYYNLADVYEQTGAPEEAISWLRSAISHQRMFRPSYYRLGALYNRQGDYAQAEQVLLAGLNIGSQGEDPTTATVSDYLLLANLGWTLFGQERYTRAEEILREAVQGETAVPSTERRALPHYALARVACQLGRPAEAAHELEEALRFVDTGRREGALWAATVNEYRNRVQAGASPCATLASVDAP